MLQAILEPTFPKEKTFTQSTYIHPESALSWFAIKTLLPWESLNTRPPAQGAGDAHRKCELAQGTTPV